MPIPTITDFTEDQLTKLEFSKARRKTVSGIVLVPDALHALLLVRFTPNVTPDDYADMRTALKAIPGFEEVELVVDHKTRPTSRLPADLRQEATVTLNIELKPIPVE